MHIAKLLPLVALLALPAHGAPRPPHQADINFDASVGVGVLLPDRRQIGPALGDLINGLPIVGLLGTHGGVRPPPHRRQLDHLLQDLQHLIDNVVEDTTGGGGAATTPQRRQLDTALGDLLHGVQELLDDLVGHEDNTGAGGTTTPGRRQLDTALDELLRGIQQLIDDLLGADDAAGGTANSPHRRQLDTAVNDLLHALQHLRENLVAHQDNTGAGGTATQPSRRQLDAALDELLHGLQQLLDDLLGADGAVGGTDPPRRRRPDTALDNLLDNLQQLLDDLLGEANDAVGDATNAPHRRQHDKATAELLHGIQKLLSDLLRSLADAGVPNAPHRRQLDTAVGDLLHGREQLSDDLLGAADAADGTGNPPRRRQFGVIADLETPGAPISVEVGSGVSTIKRQLSNDPSEAGALLAATLRALEQAMDGLAHALIGIVPTDDGVGSPLRRQLDTTLSDLLHALDAALDDLLGSHSPSGGIQNPDRRQLDTAFNELLASLRKALNDLLTGQEVVSPTSGSPLDGTGASPLLRRQLGATHADLDILGVLHTCLSAGIGRRQLLELGAEAHVLDLLHVCLGLSLGHRDGQGTASTPHRRQSDPADLGIDVDVALDLNLKKRQLAPLPIDGLGKLPIDGLPIDKLPIGKPPVPHTPSLPTVPSLPGKLPLSIPRLPANLPGLSGIPVLGGLLRRLASPQLGDDSPLADSIPVDNSPAPANERRDPPPPPPLNQGIKVDLLAAIDDIVAGHLHADAAGKQVTPPSPGHGRHTARQMPALDIGAKLGLGLGLTPPPPPPADRRQLVNLDLDLTVGAPKCDTPEFTAQLAALAGTLNANGAGNFGTLILTALAATREGCAFVFPLVREAPTLLAPQDSACGPALVAELTAHPELLLLYFSPARELHSTDFIVGGPTPEAVVPLASAELVEYWRDAVGALWLQILGTGVQAAVLEADIATATGTAIILENAWGQEAPPA